MSAFDLGILVPALLAGLVVAATHVPLGIQVLSRGIVFIDLAIAQIAVLGVILADFLGFEAHGIAVQVAALVAALLGAMLLTWTERRWPEVQEAVIGVTFIVAANIALLLLAANPRGAEHLKDLLVGQILWVDPGKLLPVGVLYAALLAIWFKFGERMGRVGFYGLFAIAVTISVQLVGLYLVFATLIVPALASRRFPRARMPVAYLVAGLGYFAGLGISLVSDLPAGPLIVCAMVAIGVLPFAAIRRENPGSVS